MNAISLVMETGFAVTAFLALFLNLFIPEEVDDEVVDVNGQEPETAVTGVSAVPNKSQDLESSRQSDVDSIDKIEEQRGKEMRP